MHTATLRPRPAKDPAAFFDDLAQTLMARRDALTQKATLSEGGPPLTRLELIEWLQFRYWYLQEEGRFIDSWLSDAPNTEWLASLGALMAERERQSRELQAQLDTLGTTTATWSPESEWGHWVSEFHAGIDDTPERVIAYALGREPAPMESLDKRLPDAFAKLTTASPPASARGRWSMALGLRTARAYATTPERQARIRARVMHAFELEQKARLAFSRRIRSIRALAAANDTVEGSSDSVEDSPETDTGND